MAVPLSHKTLFVLDHSPAFLQSSKVVVEYDIFNKARPGVIPLAPITKTLWTCAVEAVVEYCRIVYDIFATDKLIRFVLSDPKLPAFPVSWNQDAQGLDQVMAHLAEHGSPSSSCDQDDCSITAAIAKAIATLCEPTERQQRRTPDAGEAATTETDLSNGGRIVCITNCKSKAQIKMIEESMSDAFVRHNKMAAESHRREVVPAAVNSEVIVVRTGRYIAAKLAFLVQLHYDLASTTVTGIPMKVIGGCDGAAGGGIRYEMVTLKWWHALYAQRSVERSADAGYNLRSRGVKVLVLSAMLHFQPAAGRSLSHIGDPEHAAADVTLGPPRRTRARALNRRPCSEGCAGAGNATTGSTDFGDFMKDSRLAPVEADAQQQQQQQQQEEEEDAEMKPVRKAKAQLERMTRFWPMVIGETVIFNILSNLDPLPSLITKEVLDEEDVVDCKKAIYHMVAMEQRNETLAIPMIGTRGKAHKREEQYRQMWSELDTLVKAHAENSSGHQQVSGCWQL
ncbi:PREDICTED: protein asunder homolog [Priapulus caudatus]|uniref:Protein asunder n=1 Tax=Priapulus caudatus TaxID=37621 RepID=A0ABM1F0P6_PRICU|nr:PREDICTED: protein asunder homolog [Priapulus caudatus]